MDTDKSRNLTLMFEKLIKQFFGGTVPEGIKNYTLKVASGRYAMPILNEKKIKEESIAGLDEENKIKYQKLFLRLIKLKAVTKRVHILYILNKVKNFSSIAPKFEAENINPSRLEKASKSFKIELSDQKMTLMEREIVFDILHILQDKPAVYIEKSKESDEYIIEKAKILPPHRKMTFEIIQLSEFHLKLKKFTESEHLSSTEILLSNYIKNEVNQYNSFLNALINSPDLSLRKMYLWSKEPLEKLILLSIIIDSIEGLKGGQIISVIYQLSTNGNIQSKSLMEEILFLTSKSIKSMIENWCCYGVIDDQFSEFFITEDILVDIACLWTKRYQLNHLMVPCYFSQDLVQKILIIGKNINFIKLACSEPWTATLIPSMPSVSMVSDLAAWVDSQVASTGKFLLSLVRFKYNLDSHFSCLKKFILLSQGDFSQSLLSKTFNLLNKNANSLFRHETNTLLEFAIRDTNAKFEEPDCLSRLDSTILEPSPLDTGWDVFILDYNFSPPLTTIFTQSSMEVYSRAFKFLWQIKRAQYLCSQYICPRHMIIFQSYYELKQVFHTFQLLRQEMTHFVNNLFSYMIVEVVEASWKVFNKKMAEAEGLDEIIQVHDEFLNDILVKAFLNDERMYKKVLGIVEIIVSFFGMFGSLFDAGTEEKTRREVEIRHGDLDEMAVFDEMLCDVGVIKEQYLAEIKEFFNELKGKKGTFQRFLAFRLDFNQYYEIDIRKSEQQIE